MPLPRAAKIEKGIQSLLAARRNQPISQAEAMDTLVDDFGLEPSLKGTYDPVLRTVWQIECEKARATMVANGIINQFPRDLWSLTDDAYRQIRETSDAHRT